MLVRHANVAGRFVCEECDKFVGELAKTRGIGSFVAQNSELVGNQGVVGNMKFHVKNYALYALRNSRHSRGCAKQNHG